MIVGTAGHIDHGKTTLVHALTGVDTDRLPQEKQRGISIELGYAYADLAAVPGLAPQRIGFIDVPGHERLVHTMLAGATGIDHALLLVAADDGVMPQTREHLAALSLLGLTHGTVVITKCDRVDAARLAAVRAEVAAWLQGSALAAAPVLAVSAHSRLGLDDLIARLHVAATAHHAARSPPDRAFRLAIDRAFTLTGVGTVVTGTVHAGRVHVGDELVLCPDRRAGPGSQPLAGAPRLRVRSLHAQNQAADTAHAGQRCAVALAGIAKDQIARGQWLAAPEVALQTDRLDVRLQLWRDEAKALRSGMPVHVHLGAADVLASVAVLAVERADGGLDADAEALPPGDAQAWVQLVLREPVGAWCGDRVVLRDASAARTLAGGEVVDPFAPARYRRTPQRLAALSALPALRRGEASALLDLAPLGVEPLRLAAAQGGAEPAWPVDALQVRGGQEAWVLGARHAQVLREAAVQALQGFHARQPDELGPDAARLRRLVAPRLPDALWRALLDRAQADGVLATRGTFVHLPAHGVRLSAAETRLAQKVAPRLAEAGFEGAWVRDLARDAHEPEPLMRTALARLAQRGELHQVVKDLYYPTQTMTRLAALARTLAATQPQGALVAAAFRDATGLGRKRAIQVLEYFDRVGLLQRVGDAHRLRRDSQVFAADMDADAGVHARSA
jgi:selenocysteine-specific elongation factor